MSHLNHAQKELKEQLLTLRVLDPIEIPTYLGTLGENKIKIPNFHNRLEHWTETIKIKLQI